MGDVGREHVLVTEYFHPDTASTGHLMTDLAVGLQDRGLDVTVYTGQPNYHSGDNERQPRIQRHEGVLVRRIRAPQVRQSSLARRLFNWSVFTVWMFVTLALSRPRRERELVVVSNPPTLPIAMWLVHRLRGWEYTYIVYDLYPDQPVELGYIRRGGVIDRLWSALQRHALRDAKQVVTLGPLMREHTCRKAGEGFDEGTVEVIHNWEDGEFIRPRPKTDNWFSREHDLVEPFTLLYSGNIAQFHDLETVVEAVAAYDGGPIKLLVIGEGDNRARVVEHAERLGVRGDRVEFLPYQSREDLPYSLTAGDVSVVTVKRGFEGVCVSSKLYTAMAAGKPVLCISQSYDDEACIVEEHDVGIVVPQGDVSGAIQAITRWRDDPDLVESQGARARRAFETYYTREQSIDAYYRLLRNGSTAPTEETGTEDEGDSPIRRRSQHGLPDA